MDIRKWIEENKYLYGETEMVSVKKLLEFLDSEDKSKEIKRKDKKNYE